MGMISLMEQRRIGPTHGSLASLLPLRTPSGPQFTESELETELVEQLAFCPEVADIITQPVIRYRRGGRERRYTPDALVELRPGTSGQWQYLLLEAKRSDAVEDFERECADKVAVAVQWCERNGAAFRIVTEQDVRTPYLANSRYLAPKLGKPPAAEQLQVVRRVLISGPATYGALVVELGSQGVAQPEARDIIEGCVANRLVSCDLMKPFNDQSTLRLDAKDDGIDPFIALLMQTAPQAPQTWRVCRRREERP